MSRKRLRTIGILGGMGPEAGASFLVRIIRETAAGRDQDHAPVILYSRPQVPDRTRAILHGGPSPVAALRRGLRALRDAGADFAVMPCVTAHHFHARLAAGAPLPLISLVDETVAAVRKMRPATKTVGLIATTGTVRSGLVARAFAAAGIEVLVPAPRDQERVMAAIYGKKGIKAGVTAGPPRTVLLGVAAGLVRRGAQAVMAGCTEVPLALRPGDLTVPLVDPLTIGARAAVRRSGARLRRAD
ncbi:MAG TPA: amino acid racemase [Candidatus Aminicenantes bacterium]|nr:amino acid racemase [Candidatus Aminicenantes bacterium]HRY63804.1 amino acid racemase [Candidatus Aminicenantes bacterium]HRZ70717.1 amino acid racemase [Candidatus Aminicenantes bacterium]